MAREKRKKDLDEKLTELEKENQSLKKALGKLRKDVSKSQDAILLNQEYAQQIEIAEKKDKIKKCEHCEGEVKRFQINSIVFDICQRCKSRTRIKEEK